MASVASPSPSKPSSRTTRSSRKVPPCEDPSLVLTPCTPRTATPLRRSARRASLMFDPLPSLSEDGKIGSTVNGCGKKCGCVGDYEVGRRSRWKLDEDIERDSFAPISPDNSETKKRKSGGGRADGDRVSTRTGVDDCMGRNNKRRKGDGTGKGRVLFKKVVFDGGDFEVGDGVYVKRREKDDEDLDVEECRVCFEVGTTVMIECDACLGGFHLECLNPPLEEVPEGDWMCEFCSAEKSGKKVKLPKLPEGKTRARTAREKLLSGDLWAARIERF